jgi:hypothetical protein
MPTINTNSANRSYTITGLTNDVTYRVRVAAVNSIGVGPFTDYVLATPSLFAIDDNYHNVELLLNMDEVINGDSYYGNDAFILGTTQYGPNDDPYSLETKLLLHGDGIALTDSSLGNKNVYTNGAVPVQTISDSRFGTGSLSFNGSNYLTFDSSNDFSVGTGDFTVELFVKFRSINSANPICNPTSDPNGADGGKWYIQYSSGNLMVGQHATSNYCTSPWSASTNTWYHLAILRQSGTIKIFIDGVEQTVSNSTIFSSTNFNQNGFSVGRVASVGGFDGQIDEFRFTNGVARNITLPTSAYPNPSNPFRDLSPNPKTIYAINGPSTSTYSGPLPAPTNIVPSQPQSGSLTLSWTAPTLPPGASDYIIQYSTDGGIVWTTVNDGVSSNNSTTINNLPNGTYTFRIAGTNGDLQSSWTSIDLALPLTGISVEYLVVAGGGGGGNDMGGGGGAGGLITNVEGATSGGGSTAESPMYLANVSTLNVVVGAGGSGAPAGSGGSGTNGGNSIISVIGNALVTALGGGYGASQHNGNGWNANSGGCGGGGSGGRQNGSSYGGLPGSGTAKQGYDGAGSGPHWYPGGGGGAGGAGIGNGSVRGHGGPGVLSRILGTLYYWAGGGGGSGYTTTGGDGGIGGGGGGAVGTTVGGAGINNGASGGGGSTNSQTNTPGGNGGANTGGGGGGGSHYNSNNYGGTGGSGAVILRTKATATSTTGSPTVSADGLYNIYMFTGTGSITFPSASPPTPPTNITASSSTPGEATLSWDSIDGATDYVIQYRTENESNWTTVNDGTSSTNSVTISGLADGNYYFRVAAINSNGQGGWKAKSVTLPIPDVSVEALVVAGGGAGGSGNGGGGGGGAGGLLEATALSLTVGETYIVSVGAGGTAVSSNAGNTGSDSTFAGHTANGGGGGGCSPNANGKNGGSGGGSNNEGSVGGTATQTSSGPFIGYGNNGGSSNYNSPAYGGGGGGGAETAGSNGTSSVGGSGGNGRSWYGTTYAGGGGGGTNTGSATAGSGGSGGGGTGGAGSTGTAAVANTGGGGGAGGSGNNAAGSGASGVVVIKSSVAATSTTGSPIISPASDLYFKDVSILLHMNDNASVFTDVSPNPKTITAFGSATQSSTQSKWGGKSAALLGNGSYLRIGSMSNIGTQDFTLESWVFIAGSQSDNSALFDFRYPGVTGFNVEIDQSRRLSLNLPSNGRQWIATLPLSQWVYIAIARTSGTTRTYVDGILVDSTTDNNNYNLASLPYGFIGANFDFTGYGWSSPNYYIDDVRFTIGSGRNYTGSSISVPDSQFPDSNSDGGKLYIFTGTGSITF